VIDEDGARRRFLCSDRAVGLGGDKKSDQRLLLSGAIVLKKYVSRIATY